MAVDVTLFVFLLLLQSCASQAPNTTTTTQSITVTVADSTNTSSRTATRASTITTLTSNIKSAPIATIQTISKPTGTTNTHSPSRQYTSATLSPGYITTLIKGSETLISNTYISATISTFSQTADKTKDLSSVFSQSTPLNSNVSTPTTIQPQTTLSNGSQPVSSSTTISTERISTGSTNKTTHRSGIFSQSTTLKSNVSTPTTMQPQTTLSNGSQTVSSSTTKPTEEISTVGQTVTESANRTTHLSGIFSQSTSLNSDVFATTSGTLLLTTVSKATSPSATKDPTNETQSDKGNEKEIKNELGYDRDLVIIFGTMLSLMLVASIGYGIIKCKRRQKSKQFMEGGGTIQIATSKF